MPLGYICCLGGEYKTEGIFQAHTHTKYSPHLLTMTTNKCFNQSKSTKIFSNIEAIISTNVT